MFTLMRELDLFLVNLVTLNTMNGGKQLSFTLFLYPYVDAQPPYNGQRSRNLSKQRVDYFPRKAFRVEGKQI
jgi:hypothetical protein